MTAQPHVGTSQRSRSAILRIRHRPTEADKRNFLIGQKPTRITRVRIGAIQRYHLEQDTLGEHFVADCIIECRQGYIKYTPVIFRCSTNRKYFSISGSHKLPAYCREQLSRSLLNRISTFLWNEPHA